MTSPQQQLTLPSAMQQYRGDGRRPPGNNDDNNGRPMPPPDGDGNGNGGRRNRTRWWMGSRYRRYPFRWPYYYYYVYPRLPYYYYYTYPTQYYPEPRDNDVYDYRYYYGNGVWRSAWQPIPRNANAVRVFFDPSVNPRQWDQTRGGAVHYRPGRTPALLYCQQGTPVRVYNLNEATADHPVLVIDNALYQCGFTTLPLPTPYATPYAGANVSYSAVDYGY